MADDRWLLAVGGSGVAGGVASLLVPLYVVQLGGGPVAVGAAAAAAAGGGAPGGILAGRLADRTDRRRGVVVASLAAAAAALLVLAALHEVPAVLAATGVLWFALAGVAPVFTVLAVADAHESAWPDRVARLNAVQGYGTTGGLLLGALWTGAGGAVAAPVAAQRSLFVLAAALAGLAALLAARLLPAVPAPPPVSARRTRRIAGALAASNRQLRDAAPGYAPTRLYVASRALPGEGRAALRAALRRHRRGVGAYFLAAALFFAGFAVFWAPLPIFLASVGAGDGLAFGLYLANNVASAALFGLAGRLTGRRDPAGVQRAALLLRGAAFAGVGLLAAVVPAAVAGPAVIATAGGLLVIVGVTWAFVAVAGTVVVSRLAPAGGRGALLGGYTAVGALAGALGSLLGGLLAARSYPLAFGVAALLVAAGAGLVTLARQPPDAGTGVQ